MNDKIKTYELTKDEMLELLGDKMIALEDKINQEISDYCYCDYFEIICWTPDDKNWRDVVIDFYINENLYSTHINYCDGLSKLTCDLVEFILNEIE